MINYLNIYDQLQMLDDLKSTMIDKYIFTIGICIIIIILTMTVCATGAYAIIQDIKNGIRIKRSDLCTGTVLLIPILTVAIVCAIIIKPAFNMITMIENNNVDVIKLYKNHKPKTTSTEYENKINDLLTYKELQDILTVNSVSNIDAFKNNVNYLKNTYATKIKTFKVMYNKNATISEDEYINSILNQFYLDKIDNTPTDITGFEEDYPKVSINLKK
jgi:hypothetical protein